MMRPGFASIVSFSRLSRRSFASLTLGPHPCSRRLAAVVALIAHRREAFPSHQSQAHCSKMAASGNPAMAGAWSSQACRP
uniref:Uncharacterized protein n=1 Tax=Oryza meridionalis TaxID=40149 RepID=A0A0E0FC38_9ORYZ